MTARAALLPCGTRLHLQHGPIDLIIGAEGARDAAFAAATARFATVLDELMVEMACLRAPSHPGCAPPRGAIARRMVAATAPHGARTFVTPMAAVAGAVADTVLRAMCAAAPLTRAYVNNGGDIALHLTPGTRFTLAMAGHDGSALGEVTVRAEDPVRGIATSGRHGRSLSLGIADSVTVLACSAAAADVAATLVANRVDLPDHPAITRRPADTIRDDSDLGARLVVTGCGPLTPTQARRALDRGRDTAIDMAALGLIHGAALFLHGAACTTPTPAFTLPQRTAEHA